MNRSTIVCSYDDGKTWIEWDQKTIDPNMRFRIAPILSGSNQTSPLTWLDVERSTDPKIKGGLS